MVRVAPFRNPLISLISFVALIELNLAVAVVLQEKRVNNDYSETTALLAFAGTFTFCLAPFQVIAATHWHNGRFARVSSDMLLTFLFLVFHFTGAAAMSNQILHHQPSNDSFVREGSLGLLALSWSNTILIFFASFTTCTFVIRRWAGWEDGVSQMPAKQLWDEGYWGGGARKEAQRVWQEKRTTASREVAEQWRRHQAEGHERETHDEVVVVTHPATMSTDSGFSQYGNKVH